MPNPEKYRDYVIRKYVRARDAAEAIALSENLPVIEVSEMKEKPKAQNDIREDFEPALGFKIIYPDDDE